MVNSEFKRLWVQASWCTFKTTYQHSGVRTEGNHEKPASIIHVPAEIRSENDPNEWHQRCITWTSFTTWKSMSWPSGWLTEHNNKIHKGELKRLHSYPLKLIYMNVQEVSIYNINHTRPRRRWEDNIKRDLQEAGGGGGTWTTTIWLRVGTGGGHLWTR
jgi:hypothetical protein